MGEFIYLYVTMQAMRFFMSSNVTVHGLKIRNSPQFHFRFDNCRNVLIDTIVINSPHLSPNTDGIHVENSANVGIYNSVISNGKLVKLLNLLILNPTSLSFLPLTPVDSSYRWWLYIYRVRYFKCWHKECHMWTKPWNQVDCCIRFWVLNVKNFPTQILLCHAHSMFFFFLALEAWANAIHAHVSRT